MSGHPAYDAAAPCTIRPLARQQDPRAEVKRDAPADEGAHVEPGVGRLDQEIDIGRSTIRAELLRCTFAIDVLECPAEKARMELFAMLTEPRSIARFLSALGEPTDVPARSRRDRRNGSAPC
ncbi:hypothetical protein [Sorangium sp. So ce1153]|uniref:hypothetical protein n=1 Tax=Sorangium sp. So ce1153 TaxID=3133333 RepID=UPI003F5D7F2E